VSIVRSLLVRIGFITDKKGVNSANTAIKGITRNFTLAATAATFLARKVFSFFNDVAQASLEADGLARTLGISIEQLNALNKGFKKFDFNDAQINAVLRNVNKRFNEFRIGAINDIELVASGLDFEVNRNTGPLKFLKDYLIALGDVGSETERIRIATVDFGEEIGPLLSNLSQDVNGLDTAITKAFTENHDLSESTESLKLYRQSVNELNEAWDNFIISLSGNVIPALTILLKYLTGISDVVSGILRLDGTAISKGVNKISAAFDPIFEGTILGRTSDYFKSFFGGKSLFNAVTDPDALKRFSDYAENKEGYQYSGFFNPALSANSMGVTNNIEINVPPGTNLDQSEGIAGIVTDALREFVWNLFSQIQNDNPQVE